MYAGCPSLGSFDVYEADARVTLNVCPRKLEKRNSLLNLYSDGYKLILQF